jgi:biopolymer transport protein ExbD
MRLQTYNKEEPKVDLTSLIDVVFLLLIFFMVSTTFERESVLKVDLPEASAVEEREELPETLELVIDDQGRMFLNNQRLLDSRAETIEAAMEQLAGERRDVPLILRADRQTPHHFVVTAMDVAAQLGFLNLSIATDRSTGNGE